VADPQAQTAFADENLPTSFYLGREYDLATRKVLDDQRIDYESKDLVTHGVVVGMTGSGKTGLCISLLEEAAIDGIPCIMIDPKGDLSNLLLQFPNLAPEDFRRWLNLDEAEQKGLSPDDYAKQLADLWRQGLRETGQTEERIRQLREKSEYRIYTPGSEAGLPLSILQNFKAPKGNILREDLHQKIDATASALLGLTGLSADPVQSREHILIAQLLVNAWTKGRDLDLHQLIGQIQNPPFTQVGALDVETFYKEKDRMKLAVALNNILAAPSFSTWLQGDPLDLASLLGVGGRTRQLIFSVAHLDDAQRMFFITLLLSEVLSWTRKQSGTTSLRAILYFDEVFGYLPPHPGNPPTKQPLMTLFKQARAFGVGVLLATQNPVDLDYKALSNAGTWFVGKLQTERDKARLLDGLQGAAAERGARADRATLEKTIASLGNRIFLLHNIHRGGEPKVFQTRWALSYLRGPMTRGEIKELMDPFRQSPEPEPAVTHDPVPAVAPASAVPPPTPAAPPGVPSAAELAAVANPSTSAPTAPPTPTVEAAPVPVASVAPAPSVPPIVSPLPAAIPVAIPVAAPAPAVSAVPGLQTSGVPPLLRGDVSQFYLPLKQPTPGIGSLVYLCRLLGWAYTTVKGKINDNDLRYTRAVRLLAPAPADGQTVDWAHAEVIGEALDQPTATEARWGPVPEAINTVKKIKALEKAFTDYLAGLKVGVPTNVRLKLSAESEELPEVFRARCQSKAWARFEERLADERQIYEEGFKRYQVSVPADDAVDPNAPWPERWQQYLRGSPVQRTTPPATLSLKERTELTELENEWHDKRAGIAENCKQAAEQVGETALTPKKSDIKVLRFGLAWAPFWQLPGTADLVPAYR
jgi:hypothetical protein